MQLKRERLQIPSFLSLLELWIQTSQLLPQSALLFLVRHGESRKQFDLGNQLRFLQWLPALTIRQN
ncbi:Uncharacterised protein [Serratia entomophila]|nr:Uncharacterised protein [Serratia entomophila]CAI0828218.1 Uncharacterised protein [Serratia entomophila]CAI1571568.1 Uncharacterised protein [Serratia entomophila]CAI1655976.1 Uncharacterised protein [Serratia entomophila]CAI1786375.1 Uncharacterised protein [Serratia entomophila]